MKKVLFAVFLCLILVTMVAYMNAQGAPKGSKSAASADKAQKVTSQGKIEFNKSLGGYFLKTENPSQEMIIVNPNQKVLEPLYKSGKKIKVKGHLTLGAEHLFIESIDGKKYSGQKEAAPK